MILAVVGIAGFAFTFPAQKELGTETVDLIDKSLDLLTIAVPPALPSAMSVGVAFAILRLKKQGIFCNSPPRVNVSGMIQIMVFDKTGTLTEDGLEVQGVRGCVNRSFTKFFKSITNLLSEEKSASQLNEAMACCHSLAWVGDELIGDPLDVKMFESTQWTLKE